MTVRAGRLLRDAALWGGALVLVAALHLGGALWILHGAEAAAPPGLPEPVFVDLAPAEETADEPPADATDEPAAADPKPRPDPAARPEPAADPVELPPLMELEPLDDIGQLFAPPPALDVPPDLALNRSSRPERRPDREPPPEPRQQRPSEPRREAQPQQAAPRREAPAAAAQPQARRTDQGQPAAAGRSGTSPQQRARDEAGWKQQVGLCLLRSASRVSGARGSRGVVNLVIARNGRVQSAALSGSTGNARVDREITRAFGRARCPAAPPSLTQAAYNFQQPFAIR